MRFLLLTGIPRSGTTLACALLDRMDGVLCLSEPDQHVELMEQSRDAADFADLLCHSLAETKSCVVRGGSIADRRNADGSPLTNYFSDPDQHGRRQLAYSNSPWTYSGLSPDVLVGSKHNALYSAALPELIENGAFRIIAMVRDPVAVLRSWRSLQLPISAGRLPAAEKFWPEMRRLSAQDLSLLTKQIRIYDLLCQRFIQNRQGVLVLRYEDLLNDCTPLTSAAGRPMSPEIHGEWKRLIDAKYARHPVDAELREAVRTACLRKEADALLSFYPEYA